MGKRNLAGSKLSLVDRFADSDSDPMSSMGNLMDVMLVFAAGLLLALIANWNVDISLTVDTDAIDITEAQGDLERVEEGIAEQLDGFTQLGTVYRDEDSGKLYVVSPR